MVAKNKKLFLVKKIPVACLGPGKGNKLNSLWSVLTSALGLGERAVERGVDDAKKATRIVFWWSLIVPLVLIFLGVLFGGGFGAFLVRFAEVLSLASMIIALFAKAGAIWAVALIWEESRDEAQHLLSKVVLPVLFWQAVVLLFSEFTKLHEWSLGQLMSLITVVLVMALGTAVTGRSAAFIQEGFILLAEIRFFLLVLSAFFKQAINKIIVNFFKPIINFVNWSVDGWAGGSFPGNFDTHKFLGSAFAVVLFIVLIWLIKWAINKHLGRTTATTPVATARTTTKTKWAFPFWALLILAGLGLTMYFLDHTSFVALISNTPVLIGLVAVSSVFILAAAAKRNAVAVICMLVVLGLFVFQSHRLQTVAQSNLPTTQTPDSSSAHKAEKADSTTSPKVVEGKKFPFSKLPPNPPPTR